MTYSNTISRFSIEKTISAWRSYFLTSRHEKPTDPDDPLADQNIKDRFYGLNDPVAEKLMKRYSAMPKLEPPEDKLITTLYMGNLSEEITEKDLRYLYVETLFKTAYGPEE